MTIRNYPNTTTVEGFYTGQIETCADKTYTLDPSTKYDITVTSVFIKTASGTVTATVKQGSSSIAAQAASSSSGLFSSALSNTEVSAGTAVAMTLSSNSAGTDLIFRIGYEYEITLDD